MASEIDLVQHSPEVGVHKARVEAELLGATVHDFTVRLVDAHQLDVALFGAPEDPAHVTVRETGDYDRHRLFSEAFGSQQNFRICSNSNFHSFPPPQLSFRAKRRDPHNQFIFR